jgi:hypothetical protein
MEHNNASEIDYIGGLILSESWAEDIDLSLQSVSSVA